MVTRFPANRPRSRRQGRGEIAVPMKNRLYFVCGVLVVAAAAGVWLVPWAERAMPRQAPEPAYAGKPMSYWLTNVGQVYASNAPFGVVYVRSSTLLLNDSNAAPFLIKALRRDGGFAAAVYRKQVWPKLPRSVQTRLPEPVGNPTLRAEAAVHLSQMGLRAKAAIPSLIRALKEDDDLNVRVRAAHALGAVGKGENTVTVALTEVLSDKSPSLRDAAASALWQADPAFTFTEWVRSITSHSSR